ncbi:hypothetical protein BO86DRAFT_375609 [Aspergillus japonicus CBS 114.51]|uniref:Uncharacterized protein n=1 Tax=Aspergillus japonicus CBS 114.51 TaxID=1448312 RepID=A0A8T8XFK7_ASPJA|nr:hypothetical protein BO86DRAFT_375609 [Aspergillus japonicus CBS 114.51]RAH86062.1 hypothetical protein BO86DRAFT_375609 [Aspergillus japonicus CBS 114.51]
MPQSDEPAIIKTTPHGEVMIYSLTIVGTYIVVIESRDPRFKTDNWAPGLELVQERWRSKRAEYEEHQEYRDWPMGGMIRVDGHFRLYREALTADGGTGPAQRGNYHGRHEFPEFRPDVDPDENIRPLMKWLRSLHPKGESAQEDDPSFDFEEVVRSLQQRVRTLGEREGVRCERCRCSGTHGSSS